MDWIAFSYSLSSKGSSSPRVTLWRRLRRLGAIAPAGGMHLLPAREECIEAFHWLAEEIRQAQGEAMVLHVTRVDGLTDQQIIALFQAARTEEYLELDAEATTLEQMVREAGTLEQQGDPLEVLEKLRRRFAEIARVDYFECSEGTQLAARLAAMKQLLAPVAAGAVAVAPALLAEYHDARWVTRPRPHVDRLACAWLIRRFVNPAAPIRYSTQPEPDEIAFDMPDAQFGHRGNRCSFETMAEAFGLDEPGLTSLAEIVHEIDLRDGRSSRPETAGIDAVLGGWLLGDLTDAEREAHGIALFDGLVAALTRERRQDQGVATAAS